MNNLNEASFQIHRHKTVHFVTRRIPLIICEVRNDDEKLFRGTPFSCFRIYNSGYHQIILTCVSFREKKNSKGHNTKVMRLNSR